MLEVLHVLANDEQVVPPVMHGKEVSHLLTHPRVEDPEAQPHGLARSYYFGVRPELHFVVADVVGVRLDQR